jgi:hypothetical protein
MDTQLMMGKASAQLKILLPQQVERIATWVWQQNIGPAVEELKELLLAAKAMGVKDLQKLNIELPEEEKEQLRLDLSNMRRLKMEEEIRQVLYSLLSKVGVPEHYYKPADQGEKK